MENCLLCNLELEQTQNVILSNEYCMLLQVNQARIKGVQLEGAGVIVPKIHRETAFDLSEEEWNATYKLLRLLPRLDSSFIVLIFKYNSLFNTHKRKKVV